jgi:hypothetical protein
MYHRSVLSVPKGICTVFVVQEFGDNMVYLLLESRLAGINACNDPLFFKI